MNRMLLNVPAPAKLNLFLHVLGRRPDGYHQLQSIMVPVALADRLDFEARPDGRIERSGDVVGNVDDDLAVRAATLLQAASGTGQGVSIHVDKRIPAGSGLGGGSSDAATTLIALNRLWNLGLSRVDLLPLAERLGADVPFFLGAGPAFVEGIGERLTPIAWPACWYAVVYPGVHVATAEIFKDPGLTRSTEPTIIAALSTARDRFPRELPGANDLQAVAQRRAPEVGAALERLSRFGPARMTGSGSAVFAPLATESAAQEAIADLPPGWQGWAVQGLTEHPLAPW
ncbi:MAG: 4-(cytidine 5'-diphospho)-2-C-methyl-D-erythritol kinase [Burkholderiales bacterium]|jgi:4-diphosphocytidyl-2-C-methyl-D-erythritol kinase|nr:4-(cytidine 5'-diphospho)-2-C-methyl-D-erythritol kinase [Burkholderiales bacterium]